MKYFIIILLFICLHISILGQAILKVDASMKGINMSTDLIGVFFEDINYAADGGLYAEMIQNRSFEYYTVNGYVNLESLTSWSLIKSEKSSASLAINDVNPINVNNTKYLKLSIPASGEETGIKNTGFNGIPVEAGQKYEFSVYIRSDAVFKEPVMVRIENTAGKVIGSGIIQGITSGWKKFFLEINCDQTETDASLHIVTKGKGILYFDMVSLFPKNTFKNHKNGLRNDLAQAIADLQPKFLRFPGGCLVHGRGIGNSYRWKETVGDVDQRKPNYNLWGYHQTYGLGFYEYFLFSEDIGAKPLPVLPVGVSCQFRNLEMVPLDEMKPWIDDALDLIEFANGDTKSTWGKIRENMGHPEPFNLEYLCLGNEEDDSPGFRQRFIIMSDTLKKYHPEIKIIGTSGTAAAGAFYNSLWEFSREQKLYAVDEHYYMSPYWFLNNINRYDRFDRKGPLVFIGEYASQNDLLFNAISEAAYLTGIEKNADVIKFACYAPLLCNEKNNQWHPDLIRFDNAKVVKTASYYIQQLYSIYTGDEYINSSVSYADGFDTVLTEYKGSVGLGAWNTQVDYDDLKVINGDKVLIEESFTAGASEWQVNTGTFTVSEGVYIQSSDQQPAISMHKTFINATDYIITLRARKTGGQEGFLVPFGAKDNQNLYWLNIAGWANTLHAVEIATNGSKSTLVSKPGSIKKNTWYDIRIEITKSYARFYLDNTMLFEIPALSGPVRASVIKNNTKQELIIKMVNTKAAPVNVSMNISGLDLNRDAKVITLTGNTSDRNSLASPDLLHLVESSVRMSNLFDYTLPATSCQVFCVKMK